jgi:hypothetical protein
MVKMDPEFAVERVFSIAKRSTRFGCVADPLRRIDQNSRPFYFFRLVGMENRDRIEAPIQGLGFLASHQGHIGLA